MLTNDIHIRSGVVGGTFLTTIVNISLHNILFTIVMAVIGAVVSFIVSVILKRLTKHFKL